MPKEYQIEAAASAIDNLARIGRGLSLEKHELREVATAALRAAEAADKEMAIGDAINNALYQTPYDGKLNVPYLCPEQRIAAARAAINAIGPRS